MNKVVFPKEELEQLYLNEKLPMHKIAKIKNISTTKVFNLLHEYNIPTRSQKDTFTMKNHKLSPEQVERIRKMHTGKIISLETKKKMSKSKTKKGIGHKKMRTDGYIAIYFPDHPKSNKDGYIMEHDLVMECFIGRWLNKNEVVHHINNIKSDNKIENLKLMTKSEHMSMHAKERQEQRRRLLLTEQY